MSCQTEYFNRKILIKYWNDNVGKRKTFHTGGNVTTAFLATVNTAVSGVSNILRNTDPGYYGRGYLRDILNKRSQ